VTTSGIKGRGDEDDEDDEDDNGDESDKGDEDNIRVWDGWDKGM